MSVQTEIGRLSGAKSAIAAAIADKGVTVPDGTKLDGMAELIAGIEAGGGDILGKSFICGSITPAEDITTEYTVSHEGIALGTPQTQMYYAPFVFLWLEPPISYPNLSWLWLIYYGSKYNSYSCYGKYISSSGSLQEATYASVIGDAGSSNSFKIHCNSSKKLLAGARYNWLKFSARTVE